MSDIRNDPAGDASSHKATPDPKSPLQRELERETDEGTATVGDMSSDRNVSGSSTWVTLPPNQGDAPSSKHGHQRASSNDETDSSALSRQAVQEQVADRLHRRGVALSGHETAEQLVDILEAVERFEAAVAARGGDLMVDEPVGNAPPIEPDNRSFVLPKRESAESAAAFIRRIDEARAHAKRGD